VNKEQRDGLYIFLLGCVVFASICLAAEGMGIAWMVDFKAVYYGARCLIEHHDPYNSNDLLRTLKAESAASSPNPVEAGRLEAETVYINLPTSLVAVAPFASLGWRAAHVLWMLMTSSALLLSSFLIWDIASKTSPILSGALICVWLINSIPVVLVGNLAGIAIALCVVAVWCIEKEHFEIAGILCLAFSLILKPHDAWLVWLVYLLSSKAHRKRSLQSLAIAAALSCCAIAWVQRSSPHWFTELHHNIMSTSLHGGINDPGPAYLKIPTVGSMVNFQSVVSIFNDTPSVYNLVTFIICGALFVIWVAFSHRSDGSSEARWIGLAAVSCLSLLPVYHRTHDAKLILLAVPACAILYSKYSAARQKALWLTAAAFILTGDIVLYSLASLPQPFAGLGHGVLSDIANVVLFRPAPLILLVCASFYLWMYIAFVRKQDESQS
jgi:hypothetical protein